MLQHKCECICSEYIEEKVYCTATVNEKFSDQSIIVTLSNAESLLFKDYVANDFYDINCVEIEDLTEFSTEIVREQLIAEQTGDWSKLENRIENNMLIDIDNFHRVLCLTLDINSKQNVLDKIKILEGRTEIIIAEPDYIETLEIVSNDPFNTISNQWGLNGTRGISANKTWNITTGNNRVLVGIIDSGIDGHHPDLINNINEDLHRDYVDTPLLSNVRKIDKDVEEATRGIGDVKIAQAAQPFIEKYAAEAGIDPTDLFIDYMDHIAITSKKMGMNEGGESVFSESEVDSDNFRLY